MIDDTLALGNQVEVVREGLCISHQGMRGPRERSVLQTLRAQELFPGLNAQLDRREKDIVLGDLKLGPAHHEPFSGAPLLVISNLVSQVEAILHAHDRLIVLTHGQLFQVIVGLEQNLPDAGARQPLRLKTFHQHRPLDMAWKPRRIHRIQGEYRLSALQTANSQGKAQVLQVHGSCRFLRLGNAHGAWTLEYQTTHASPSHPVFAPRGTCTSQGKRRTPSDVEFQTAVPF
mmetsp:Transcript_100842/g.252805  ORF Transcript_100842/g.252805 Transcript_100842/m.252805 type:complete len:231 (+) Transcript_100842:342-1034(+)